MQKTLLLYKWFNPAGSVVIIQMTLLRGTEKQCQFFVCVERTIKEKQIILCGLINSSTHTARRMNTMHVAQLTFFLKAEMGENSCGFCYFSTLTPRLVRWKGYKRIGQNLKCDMKEKFRI